MPSTLPRMIVRGSAEEIRRSFWLAERAGCSVTKLVMRLVNAAYLAHPENPDDKARHRAPRSTAREVE